MQANSSHLSDPFVSTFGWAIKLAILVLIIVKVYWYFIRRNEKTSGLQTRMLRKFHYTHYELLPQLDIEERKEMFQVLRNTITNAELFKDKELNRENYVKTKKSVKSPSKKVNFNL